MNYEIGSTWHKWDLHVHTPCSIVQHYGGNTEAAWEKYIQELENLPPEFKVLGINDYLFIDGYEKILQYKEQGRLKNIDLFLPVIEFRLSLFGGTSKHWNKVNFHVIFADQSKISVDKIRSQFLNTLSTGYKLSPDFVDKLDWNAIPTRESLSDLGQMIIDSVPAEKRKDFGSPLIEGFNNLNYDYDKIINNLKQNTYFDGNYFTAIGKTEWENLEWNDHSIADKKNVINRSNFVFTSAISPDSLVQAKNKLVEQKVNSRLLDCSDSHYYSESEEKDRIGKCYTWIKADTSFEGLRQILFEPGRIFLGEIPPKINYVSENKTKYIKSIEIKKKQGSTISEKWFNQKIELSKDLIAIIGNKGSGKSALVDIIGLLGNTKIKRDHFPFLNQGQFLKESKANNFVANLTWESSEESGFTELGKNVNNDSVEMVRYIPQNYFEEICNQLTQSSEDSDFYRELSKVIFSHVNISERLGKEDIDQLINHHREEIDIAIRQSELKLNQVNKKIIEIEDKMKPEYKRILENKISTKKKEIESLVEPQKITKPNQDEPKIKRIAEIIEKYKSSLKEKENIYDTANETNKKLHISLVDIEKLRRKIENFENAYKELIRDLDSDKKQLMDSAISLTINFEIFDNKITEIKSQITKNNEEIQLIETEISKVKGQIIEKQNELDKPNKEYQEYVTKFEIWNNKKKELIGNETTPESLKYFEQQLLDLKDIESKLSKLFSERFDICKEILTKKLETSTIYSRLYSPVQNFIESQQLSDEFKLKFSVSIEIEGFSEAFFGYISRGVAGSFYRVEEGGIKLTSIVNSNNYNSFDQVQQFINQVIDHLSFDRREGKGNAIALEDQLLNKKERLNFYNFLFGLNYLKPRFILKLGDKDIQMLSPGEKGTLLLVFYLLIDQDRIPLLIDQPEQNLDNQTVYKLLVECVKKAKQYRQIIVVTHNPNLAVVCDADQIICTKIEKTKFNEVSYEIGAIENPKINKKIIDILEGTKPAFDQRRFKYLLDSYSES